MGFKWIPCGMYSCSHHSPRPVWKETCLQFQCSSLIFWVNTVKEWVLDHLSPCDLFNRHRMISMFSFSKDWVFAFHMSIIDPWLFEQYMGGIHGRHATPHFGFYACFWQYRKLGTCEWYRPDSQYWSIVYDMLVHFNSSLFAMASLNLKLWEQPDTMREPNYPLMTHMVWNILCFFHLWPSTSRGADIRTL